MSRRSLLVVVGWRVVDVVSLSTCVLSQYFLLACTEIVVDCLLKGCLLDHTLTFLDTRGHEDVIAAIALFLTHGRLVKHLLLSTLALHWCAVTRLMTVRSGEVVLIVHELVADFSRPHRSLVVVQVGRDMLRVDKASASP